MQPRRPRGRYIEPEYPQYGSGPTRRSALRRLGGFGGLLLLGSTPWTGRALALALDRGGNGWKVEVPEDGPWSAGSGEWSVRYRVVLRVDSGVIADCIEASEAEIVGALDDYFLGLDPETIEDEKQRPAIENHVVVLIAGICPYQDDPGDDDSADPGDDDSAGPGDDDSADPGDDDSADVRRSVPLPGGYALEHLMLILETGEEYYDDDFEIDGDCSCALPGR